MRNAIALATTLMLCACSVPVGPIAGSKLEGTPAEWPDDWSFSERHENFLLETNSKDPYSVTVWAVDVDGELYITAVSPENQWVKNLQMDPFVVIALDGKLYSGRAHVISDQQEMANVGKRYGTKYEMSADEGASIIDEGGIIYRLSPR